jgi:hypothetical protein
LQCVAGPGPVPPPPRETWRDGGRSWRSSDAGDWRRLRLAVAGGRRAGAVHAAPGPDGGRPWQRSWRPSLAMLLLSSALPWELKRPGLGRSTMDVGWAEEAASGSARDRRWRVRPNASCLGECGAADGGSSGQASRFAPGWWMRDGFRMSDEVWSQRSRPLDVSE